mmetsp:Transcript_12761/g.10645  ORF Transcript_12761/g.10645 Transcript_12761/m.10645 type:complete len:127 (+) Transcript_12761:155-535(+)
MENKLVNHHKSQTRAAVVTVVVVSRVMILLVVIRLLLAAWFLWAVNETRKEAGMKLRYFLAKFAGLGMLYFFSYPVLFIITGLFAPYYRQKVMLIGWFGIKYAVFAWMTSMFLTRGDYFQITKFAM